MTCRKRIDGGETEVESLPRDEPGGDLLIGQVLPGMKVARSGSGRLCGTYEPVAPILLRLGLWREGDPQVAESTRSRVPMRGTGTDRRVVAVMSGNADGAKAPGCPGVVVGQLPVGRRSR